MSTNNVDATNKPRLCHITKWTDFNGYGFNLHAEKGKAGQYIGKVDSGSPSEAAGLKEGDRIVEVNGVNIGNENHQQVVSRIKAGGEETRLLVVDSETDQHYKSEKKVVKGDLPEVVCLSSVRTISEPEQQNVEVPPSYIAATETIASSHVEEVQTSVTTTSSVSSSQFRPRLCHMKKRPDFSGYGFNLHAEKDKPGQYIGKIDDNSPAQAADLREGDRIVEVNGTNIESETHGRVIELVKSGGDETRLLVVDKAADEYYKSQGVTVSSAMVEVVHNSSVPEEGEEVSSVVETPPVFHIPPPPTELPPPEYEEDFNVDELNNEAINYEATQEVVEATQTPELEAEVALPEHTAPEDDVKPDEEVEQISASVVESVETAVENHETTADEIEQTPAEITETVNETIESTENEIERQVDAREDEVAEVAQTAEVAVENAVVENAVQEDVAENVVTDVTENVTPEAEEHVQEEVTVATETVEEATTVVNGQTSVTETTVTTTTYSPPEPQAPEPVVQKTVEAPKQANGSSNDPFGLSAKEMQAMLKSKKKKDPRSQPMGFGQKHDLFERL